MLVVKNALELFCGCEVSDQGVDWLSDICCSLCGIELSARLNEKLLLMVWRELN
jgi:hypothetical protein